jgi:hypothetical protein
LTGQVSTLQTNHAKSLARDLIREHDLLGLDPITIGDVIRPGKYGLSNEVSQFIIGDMDPDVLETWEKVLDLEKHGFGDPAPEADGQEAPVAPAPVAPAPVAPAPAPTRTPSEQPPPKIFENQFFIPKSQRSSAVPQGTPNTVAGESPARQWETVQGDLSGADLRALQKVWGGGFLTPEEEKRLKVVHERHQLGEPNFNAWLKRRLRQIQTNAAVDAVRA